MIVRSEVSPAAGSGPVVGGTSVRPRTVSPMRPSPASEVPSSGIPSTSTPPCDDPETVAHLQRLVAEREPSLQDLLLERDPYPEFYTPLAVMLEAHVSVVVGEWNGRIPK